jgi:hypothetical protein
VRTLDNLNIIAASAQGVLLRVNRRPSENRLYCAFVTIAGRRIECGARWSATDVPGLGRAEPVLFRSAHRILKSDEGDRR